MEPTHAIMARHNWYKGTLGVRHSWIVRAVGSRSDCLKIIDKWESSTYHLAHGESGRPEYKVVTIRSLTEKQYDEVKFNHYVENCAEMLRLYEDVEEV